MRTVLLSFSLDFLNLYNKALVKNYLLTKNIMSQFITIAILFEL